MVSGLEMKIIAFRQTKNKDKLNVVILARAENVIYVDFAYLSLYDSIDKWYDLYYQWDKDGSVKSSHLFHLNRFYDKNKFRDHKTIGEERDKLLEGLDLIMQMRRDD